MFARVLVVLDDAEIRLDMQAALAQRGKIEEMHDTISRAGRTIAVIRKSKPLSKRRH